MAQSGRINQGRPSGGGSVLAEAKSTTEIAKAIKELGYTSRESQTFSFDVTVSMLGISQLPVSPSLYQLCHAINLSFIHSGSFQKHCHTDWDSGRQQHSMTSPLGRKSYLFFHVQYMGSDICHTCGGPGLMS